MITLGMLRRLVLGSLTLAAGCDVGSVLAHQGGSDGGGSGSGGCPTSASNQANVQSGHHPANGQPGDGTTGVTSVLSHEGCFDSGCHNANLMPKAPSGDYWSYGGEVFKDTGGTMPYAGATVMLSTTGASPMTTQLTVAQNGFFWMPPGTGFPAPSATQSITVTVCDGTDMVVMSQSLANVQGSTTTDDGNCTASACHGTGASNGFVYLTPPT
jgi:hypothetical protein